MKKLLCLMLTALAVWSATAQEQPVWDDATSNGLIGWACYEADGLSGTTGGAGGKVVHVTTGADLIKYAKATEPYVIFVDADLTSIGTVSVNSNKTIIGGGKGAKIYGSYIDINGKQNIIIRNLTVEKGGPDAIAARNSHHLWFDHLDLSDSSDGLLDLTLGSSYITVSWCRMHDHNKVSLANSGTSHFEDVGRNHVTYHHNWFYSATQRNPRMGYGLGHIFNNYYKAITSYCIGYFCGTQMYVENSYFLNSKEPFNQSYSSEKTSAFYGYCKSVNNKFVSCSGNQKDTGDETFTPGEWYDYQWLRDPVDSVPALVEAFSGPQQGIGNDILPLPGNGARFVTKPALKWAWAGTVSAWEIRWRKATDNCYNYATATTASFEMPDMEPGADYVWQVRGLLADSSYVTGDLWHLRTAPAAASRPTPTDQETAAKLRYAPSATSTAPVLLTWQPAFQTASYRVYFDTVPQLDSCVATTATATYGPGALKYGQDYYWRVDAVGQDGQVTEGEVWTFRSKKCLAYEGKTECENMVLNCRAFLETSTDDANGKWFKAKVVSGESGPGTMSCNWAGEDAVVTLTVRYFDEDDDRNYFGIFVNEKKVGSIYSSADNNKMTDKTFSNITLLHDDEIRVEFYEDHNDDKEQCRTDYITIRVDSLLHQEPEKPVDALTAVPVSGEDAPVYNLLGRRVYELQRGQLYISKGRKFIY